MSSHFPGGYEAISYERGTWLFHMLRSHAARFRNGRSHPRKGAQIAANADEPFFRALRKIRERYAGKSISTAGTDRKCFEEELPRPLWYDNRHKLDWFLKVGSTAPRFPQLEAREIRISDEEWRDHRYRHDRTKGRAGRSGHRRSRLCRRPPVTPRSFSAKCWPMARRPHFA